MANIIKTVFPAGIVVKQTVRFGKPCIKGTRIAVTDILDLLQRGYGLDDVAIQYPDITVTSCLTRKSSQNGIR